MRTTPDNVGRLCSAKRTNGEKCGRWAIKGGTVCIFHGGATTAARAAAQNRLLAMVEPAFAVLMECMESDAEWKTKVQAALGVLDRAGFGPTKTLAVEDGRKDLSGLSLEQLQARALALSQRIKERAETAGELAEMPAQGSVQ